ncbi:MAG: hypothetical protein EOP50_07020, partial [Sphingobacteriales bacterium]
VDARSIGYVECHGTGTPMGDPIEVAGLTAAFRLTTEDRGFCALGSVKSNVGHLDAAAGVTGLIKASLAVKSGVLPASLHVTQPNPALELPDSPFFIADHKQEWPGQLQHLCIPLCSRPAFCLFKETCKSKWVQDSHPLHGHG